MRWAIVFLVCVCAGSVSAQTYPGCSKSQSVAIRTAIIDSKALAVVAAAAVGPTAEYERWFGRYAPGKAEVVRSNFKAIVQGIRTGLVTGRCTRNGVGACEDSTYAFVYDDEPYDIHFCNGFFDLPKMSDLDPMQQRFDNGTRAGTIIHEVSHFRIVAGTEDECYSRSDCSRMARHGTNRAVRNADSYQYFAEDVTYYSINPDAARP